MSAGRPPLWAKIALCAVAAFIVVNLVNSQMRQAQTSCEMEKLAASIGTQRQQPDCWDFSLSPFGVLLVALVATGALGGIWGAIDDSSRSPRGQGGDSPTPF